MSGEVSRTMDFSLQAAVDYIPSKLDDFYSKGSQLTAQWDSVNFLLAAYDSAGLDSASLAQLANEINNDILAWQAVERKLTPIASLFGYTPPNLGFAPIIIAYGAIIIAVAVAMYLFYQSNKIDQHSEAIKLIASKIQLTDQEQSVITNATKSSSIFGDLFSGLGTIGTYLIIGIAAYLVLRR